MRIDRSSPLSLMSPALPDKTAPHIASLPNDTLEQIVGQLDAVDLVRAGATCKQLRALTSTRAARVAKAVAQRPMPSITSAPFAMPLTVLCPLMSLWPLAQASHQPGDRPLLGDAPRALLGLGAVLVGCCVGFALDVPTYLPRALLSAYQTRVEPDLRSDRLNDIRRRVLA